MIETILAGFVDAVAPINLMIIAAGVLLGIIVGAIPGLNAPMAIAIAVPLTFYMSPLGALAFLLGVNKGGSFGGSISGILMNTPGSPEAAATAIDGYPLAQKGKPLKAMKMALYASVVGDTFSDIVLILVAAPLAILALKMGPVEICALVIFAFTMIAGLVGKSVIKGLIAAAAGVFFSTIGTDPTLASPRLTFGFIDLQSGIPLMAIGIGMLALSEVILQIEQKLRGGIDVAILKAADVKADRGVSWLEFRGCLRSIARSAVIGTLIGALPGLGATIAGFLGYGAAKRASSTPEEFGKGKLEGVAAAEAANSAVVGANLIPLLSLGIPGNVSAALLVGAFIIHGVTPGPWMFEEHGQLVYGMFAAMLIANVMNLIIGHFGLRGFVHVLRVPKPIILPVLVLLCLTGAYLNDQSFLAVGLMIAFALLGYVMRKLEFSFVTFIIGFVLGPMLELSLSQAYIIMQADITRLVNYPIAFSIVILTVVAVGRFAMRRREGEAPAG